MPLAKVDSVGEVERFPFPDPLAAGRMDNTGRGYRADFRPSAVDVRDGLDMVGMEKFMADLATREPYVEALLDKCLEFSLGIGKQAVALGVDGVSTGDDFGAQNGMMISPRCGARFSSPLCRVFRGVKAVKPDVLVMYHCDGAMAPILDDLAESGRPVQPNVPGHEPEALKARFGSKLSFWGAIDQQYLLPTAREEIETTSPPRSASWGRAATTCVRPRTFSRPTRRPKTSRRSCRRERNRRVSLKAPPAGAAAAHRLRRQPNETCRLFAQGPSR